MSMIEEVSSGCTPLCFLPNGKLVCYKYGEVLICENGLVVKKNSTFVLVQGKILK